MINPISIDIAKANSEIMEVNMKLLDKLFDRKIITPEEYDAELRKMADTAGISYYKPPEPPKPKKSIFYK